jgi:hypothetical protein
MEDLLTKRANYYIGVTKLIAISIQPDVFPMPWKYSFKESQEQNDLKLLIFVNKF